MKSKLFSNNDLLREEAFEKDVKVLIGLPSGIIEQLPPYALKAVRSETPRELDCQWAR